jgi:hypothetical protein
MPLVYSGTTTVEGIGVYEFVENVTPTQIASVTLPGSYVHSKAASVTIGEFDAGLGVYYVDPETGALVAGGVALLAGIFLSRRPREDTVELDDVSREVTGTDSGR